MATQQPDDRERRFLRAVGEVVRELRAERGVTQDELAEYSGRSVNHVSFVERGLRSPSLLIVFDLARGLGLTPSELVARIERRLADTAE